MPNRTRDPRTKEELLDRMLSYDFDGDIRHLGSETASIERIAPNRIALKFPDSGRTYELQVRIPREEDRQSERRSFASQDGDDQWTAPAEEPQREARQPRGG